jgi:hypothetical protein
MERCFVCKKKLLLPIDCECGQKFCVAHRHHSCEIRRLKELEQLKKNMPVVAPSKLTDKI